MMRILPHDAVSPPRPPPEDVLNSYFHAPSVDLVQPAVMPQRE